MEDLKTLQSRKKEIEKELKTLPYISIFDDDGEVNEDAYQERLEQNYYKEELKNEIKDLDREIMLLEFHHTNPSLQIRKWL